MRDETIVVILYSRDYLEEHGYNTGIFDENPSLEGIPVLCQKSAQTVWLKRAHTIIIHEYMIKESYKEKEAQELFPEAFI